MPDNNSQDSQKKRTKCPFCNEQEIEVPDDVEVGDFLECENCAAEVEVISTDPFRVRIIMEEK